MSYIKRYAEEQVEKLSVERQRLIEDIYRYNSELRHDQRYSYTGKEYPWYKKTVKKLADAEARLEEVNAELEKYKQAGFYVS